MKKLSLILVFIGFVVELGFSQEVDLLFSHLTTEDGLSNNSVKNIIQDNNGFLWFATLNGLNRYDGNKIKIYKSEPGNPNSLSHNRIYTLYEDSLGFIWIFTFDNNLTRFNPVTEEFININNIIKLKYNHSYEFNARELI